MRPVLMLSPMPVAFFTQYSVAIIHHLWHIFPPRACGHIGRASVHVGSIAVNHNVTAAPVGGEGPAGVA
jgi:hypothetical protein